MLCMSIYPYLLDSGPLYLRLSHLGAKLTLSFTISLIPYSYRSGIEVRQHCLIGFGHSRHKHDSQRIHNHPQTDHFFSHQHIPAQKCPTMAKDSRIPRRVQYP